MKPLQFVQIMFFHAIIDVNIPASLYYYFLELKLSIFQFLPNWFSANFSSEITLHWSSSQKTIDIFTDFNFLRNQGQIFIQIVILAFMWALFMILSNKRVIEHKIWHSILETISHRRYKLMVINDVISLFYVPILWFGFSQMQ